ncbi:fibroblast growth factor receptor 3-like, partial [Saccoglossus kowalevskii]|uniref:Platelet-derived growth factor receptor alpha-like n=1 Tax=Saccoglossus kowalevskii TaxID=10224 RepID=A0ABM0M9D2_SACKO
DIVNSDNIIDGEADVMVQDIKKWIIKASELKIDNVIGEGGFGIVFRAKYKKAEVKEITVAVKTMRGNASSMEERSLLSEAYNHIRLGIHNNIVNIHGIVVNDGPLKLVVEYAEQGDLLAYLHYLDKLNKAQRSLFSERVSQEGLFLTDVAIHVAQGLEFLHSKHVIHRDIAARNVVIYGDGIGKICDLGLSRDVYQTIYCKRPSPSDEERDMQLPIRWMAPETLAGDFVYSNKSDMWSYGVLLWEISALGQRPYHHVKPEHLLSIIRYGNIKLKKCAGCPIELYNVMKHCWQEDVKNRPSAGEMVLRLRRLKHQKKVHIYFCDPIIPVDVLTSVPRQSVPRHKYTNTIQINSMELSVFE